MEGPSCSFQCDHSTAPPSPQSQPTESSHFVLPQRTRPANREAVQKVSRKCGAPCHANNHAFALVRAAVSFCAYLDRLFQRRHPSPPRHNADRGVKNKAQFPAVNPPSIHYAFKAPVAWPKHNRGHSAPCTTKDSSLSCLINNQSSWMRESALALCLPCLFFFCFFSCAS